MVPFRHCELVCNTCANCKERAVAAWGFCGHQNVTYSLLPGQCARRLCLLLVGGCSLCRCVWGCGGPLCVTNAHTHHTQQHLPYAYSYRSTRNLRTGTQPTLGSVRLVNRALRRVPADCDRMERRHGDGLHVRRVHCRSRRQLEEMLQGNVFGRTYRGQLLRRRMR